MFNIYNEDCLKTIDRMIENGIKIDGVMTSPPYNTSRETHNTEYNMNGSHCRYNYYKDDKSIDEYLEWTVDLFNKLDNVLKKDGVILYNMSYGNASTIGLRTQTMWLTIAEIIKNTPFMIADRIIWKKNNAFPINGSHNKLTRIVEDVFVICRKSEFTTYTANKEVASVNPRTQQKFYRVMYNLIEAKNNDGKCLLNRATYSSELCDKLLNMYFKEGAVIYDPFNGTGTTGVSCKNLNMHYIGSEIDPEQCEYSIKRIKGEL